MQVIPHVTDAIKDFIRADTGDADFVLCEIGGTVGDIESLPFLEAIRQLGNELGRSHSLYVHLTLVPYIPSAGELKTKPTQHSVKELLGLGIQPDILLCRCEREIPAEARRKIALFCNLRESAVIPALDVDTIYQVPIAYHGQGFDTEVMRHFGVEAPEPALGNWRRIVERIRAPEGEVTIAIVGKYVGLKDAYKSLSEALGHGGIANNVRVHLNWIDLEVFEREDAVAWLEDVHGILVPGGFGERGAEGKIAAVRFARERKVPFFGICFGMQMAVIEATRNLPGSEGQRFDRVRSRRAPGRGPDDGMGPRQRSRATLGRRQSRRHHAARRLPMHPRAGQSGTRNLRRRLRPASVTGTAMK